MKTYRVIKHIRYIRNYVTELKYDILNGAIKLTLNETKVFLLKKYEKRLHLLRM
jgi:hypothetical protein